MKGAIKNTHSLIGIGERGGIGISIGVFFISIYDSCQDFIVKYDLDRIKSIGKSVQLVQFCNQLFKKRGNLYG